MGIRSPLNLLFVFLLFMIGLWPLQSEAQTRRAFLIGNQRYTDGYINPLSRTVNDAKDLAKDLEDAGFDKKDIKVVTDIKNKTAFDKEFDAFLKTIQPGDFVFFYYSGHGSGVSGERKNYLLLTDVKSPFNFTRDRLRQEDRRNPDVIRLRVDDFLDAYEVEEIPRSGIATSEIERRLAEKNPSHVLMILDACRSLARSATDQNEKTPARGGSSGSRMIIDQDPSPNFMVLYSAQFGEQAAEGFSNLGRNSLFTEVLRLELPRPGQTIRELATRVKLMVRAIALDFGAQQEPEFTAPKGSTYPDEILLIGSIGRERFRMPDGNCDGGKADWEQVRLSRKRDLLERHVRRYKECDTAEAARREILRLALSSDDPIELTAPEEVRGLDKCDQLAAAETDFARPPEVPGVPFEKIVADDAIKACTTSAESNRRVARYRFNLGRAYHKLGVDPETSKVDAARAFREAMENYEKASDAGYVSALNNLAVLYETADGVERDDKRAIELYKRGADQGHPLAMYNLAMHYRNGYGVRRSLSQAAEYFSKAADAGYVSAMVEMGRALVAGQGISNPRRGMDWLQRAANQGSGRAKWLLGVYYYLGADDRSEGVQGVNAVTPDLTLSLLWLGRLADTRDIDALALLAGIMQDGSGLSSAQPEIAERYWRLAAYGGDASAQATLADRLRRGFALVKQEYGPREPVILLRRAVKQGSAQAALALAQIYRDGEFEEKKNPVNAMRYAYQAIELAVQNDKVVETRGEPFPEMGAAHLLSEMAKDPKGGAVDARGRPLLTPDEVDRLEHFYGAVDPKTGKVKIRRLDVKLNCEYGRRYDRRKRRWFPIATSERREEIWVWDWGRPESPTEFQFRNLERKVPACSHNEVLRRTLIDIFEQAKKSKVSFADLVDQKVRTAKNQAVAPVEKERRGRRRGRG